MFDANGGGHRNACGCRIVPLSERGEVEERELQDSDLARNISYWMEAWNQGRDSTHLND